MELESNFPSSASVFEVKVQTLNHFKGELPRYESSEASGFDIRAQLEKSVPIKIGERVLIPTGLIFEIPKGFELQVRPRSGLALKKGLAVLNSPGTIDSDYRGELKIILINLGQEPICLQDQDRIAQVVLCPVYQAKFSLVDQVKSSKRGGSGFGSTGVR